jgi:eukaryotic-like serine/threonine-protein kinase
LSYHPADDAAAVPTPTRLGRYELIGQLATGGMAEIHLARLDGEAGFEKTVVVKRLLPELVASKAYVAMFLEEGKLVARLSHPNVCEVHELGRDGAEYFLVMPYLDGVPASDFIARPRDPDRIAQLRVAAGIIAQACAGLHHAHELAGDRGAPLGLVHRDVSPSNLFVTTAGVVKVLDFGIAKVLGGAETEAGTIKGKTQYMAPEQLLGDVLDRRCDVFALGIVLFELATHQRLFKRASDYLAARAILEEPIPRADAVDPAVPAAFADVIATALERSHDQRHASARDLGKAIEAAMAPHGGVASTEEIAAALAEWHGAELSAMRTRQAKVIADARSRVSQITPVSGQPPTLPGKLVAEPSRVRTMPRSVVRKRRRGVIALATLVIAGSGALLAVSLSRESRRNAELAAAVRAAGAVEQTGDDTEAARLADDPPVAGAGEAGAPIEAHVAAPIAEASPGAPVADQPAADRPARRRTEPKKSDPKQKLDPRSKATPAIADDRPGTFSIDSAPYATIYVDGTKLGVTPLVGKTLPAGKHTIKAVTKDGREQTFSITIAPGKLTNRGTLTNW